MFIVRFSVRICGLDVIWTVEKTQLWICLGKSGFPGASCIVISPRASASNFEYVENRDDLLTFVRSSKQARYRNSSTVQQGEEFTTLRPLPTPPCGKFMRCSNVIPDSSRAVMRTASSCTP